MVDKSVMKLEERIKRRIADRDDVEHNYFYNKILIEVNFKNQEPISKPSVIFGIWLLAFGSYPQVIISQNPDAAGFWLFSLQNRFDRLDHIFDSHAVELDEFVGLAGLAELIVNADEFHGHRVVLRQYFRHG